MSNDQQILEFVGSGLVWNPSNAPINREFDEQLLKSFLFYLMVLGWGLCLRIFAFWWFWSHKWRTCGAMVSRCRCSTAKMKSWNPERAFFGIITFKFNVMCWLDHLELFILDAINSPTEILHHESIWTQSRDQINTQTKSPETWLLHIEFWAL